MYSGLARKNTLRGHNHRHHRRNRQRNPRHFLRQEEKVSQSRDILLVFVASAIQNDGKPPRMHAIRAASRVLRLGTVGPILEGEAQKVVGYTFTVRKETLESEKDS